MEYQQFYRNASNLNDILTCVDMFNNNNVNNNNTSSSAEEDSENDNSQPPQQHVSVANLRNRPPFAQQFSAEGHLLLCLRRFNHQQRHQVPWALDFITPRQDFVCATLSLVRPRAPHLDAAFVEK